MTFHVTRQDLESSIYKLDQQAAMHVQFDDADGATLDASRLKEIQLPETATKQKYLLFEDNLVRRFPIRYVLLEKGKKILLESTTYLPHNEKLKRQIQMDGNQLALAMYTCVIEDSSLRPHPYTKEAMEQLDVQSAKMLPEVAHCIPANKKLEITSVIFDHAKDIICISKACHISRETMMPATIKLMACTGIMSTLAIEERRRLTIVGVWEDGNPAYAASCTLKTVDVDCELEVFAWKSFDVCKTEFATAKKAMIIDDVSLFDLFTKEKARTSFDIFAPW